jgi:hypothetical protein
LSLRYDSNAYVKLQKVAKIANSKIKEFHSLLRLYQYSIGIKTNGILNNHMKIKG